MNPLGMPCLTAHGFVSAQTKLADVTDQLKQALEEKNAKVLDIA